MKSRPLRVGLLWHSLASGNLGVDALTAASLSILTEEAAALGLEVQPIVIGMDDSGQSLARRSDVRFFPVRRKTLLTSNAFWKIAGELECAIDIGAGDSFADIYGLKRFGFLWLTKAIVLARGVPLLFAPQTIGPFRNPLARQLAARVLGPARAVITRDRQSLDLVRAIAPAGHVEQGIDVAFELPFADRSAERGSPKMRIGINVSGLLADQARRGTNRFGLTYDYLAAMEQLAAALVADGDKQIFAFTHVAGNKDFRDDDGWAVDGLVSKVPGLTRVPDFADASQAKSFISSLDFVVAARMHACVAALSSGVPVVPVAYSRKFAGLFGGIGYDVEIPIRGLDTAGAVSAMLDLVSQHEALQVKVDASRLTAAGRTGVYRAALRGLLAQASKPE